MTNFTSRDLGLWFFLTAITTFFIRPSLLAVLLVCLVGISLYLIFNKNNDKQKENSNKKEEEK